MRISGNLGDMNRNFRGRKPKIEIISKDPFPQISSIIASFSLILDLDQMFPKALSFLVCHNPYYRKCFIRKQSMLPTSTTRTNLYPKGSIILVLYSTLRVGPDPHSCSLLHFLFVLFVSEIARVIQQDLFEDMDSETGH